MSPRIRCIGADYFWLYYCKQKDKTKYPNLTYKEYKSIYNDIFLEYREMLLNSYILYFPYRIGYMQLIDIVHKPKIGKKGKLIDLPPVDWKSTKELWEIDEEAKHNKRLLRFTKNKYTVVKFQYHKKITYKNIGIYAFQVNRSLKQYIKSRKDEK